VRELQNVLERGMILSEQNLITEKALPLDLVVTLDQGSSDQPFQTLQEIEREHILKVLDYVNGHRTKAAKILGVGRKTLYRKIQELNLGP
jgi:two-component system NtrC family response regulator